MMSYSILELDHYFMTAAIRRTGVLILIAVFSVGCTAYHSMPITPEAVEARLRVPDIIELSLKAAAIRHPLILPVKLHPDQGLSPDEAAVLAVLLNPSLRAIRDQRALAHAQLIDAGLLPNPELSASLDVPAGGSSGKVNAFGLSLNWDITSLISRSARVDMGKKYVKSVDLEAAWQEWQIAQAARDAVNQWLCLDDQMDISKKNSRHLKDYLACVKSAVSAGVLTVSELEKASEDSRKADEDLMNLEKQAARQVFLLKQLIGLPPETDVHFNKEIKLPSFVRLPYKSSPMLTDIEKRRPDLLALRYGYDSQEAAVRTAVLEQFPAIRIGPSISRDTDNMHTTGAVLSMELPIFNRNQGKIARAEATRQKLFDEYISRIFEARSDILRLTAGIHDTNKQIASALAVESELKQRLEKINPALNSGRTDVQKYNTVLQGLFDIQIKIAVLKGRIAGEVVSLQSVSGYYE